jgi:predicted RNA binding protein YcfA (HicA-like mRNA interferase family)
MPKLPHISGKEAINVFQKLGFHIHIARQKGSHVVLRKANAGCGIPLHRELAAGTLSSALKQANLTAEEFLEASNQK